MKFAAAALAPALILAATSADAVIILREDFDGGGINSVFNYTNSSGAPPATAGPGSNSATSGRLTGLNASNNNSIAFNAVAVPATPTLRVTFDFRLSDDAANTAAGGCCGQAADGLGLGFFPTQIVGLTGGSNPSVGAGPFPAFNWERPSTGAVPNPLTGSSSLLLAMDVFQGTAGDITDGNHVSLTWNGAQIANVDPGFSLNNNLWHRAILNITDLGVNAQVTLDLIQDVNGAAIQQNAFSVIAAGLDGFATSPLGTDFRMIGGGRTGGAFHEGRFDNIMFEAVPEPGSLALLGLALGLVVRRRRQ